MAKMNETGLDLQVDKELMEEENENAKASARCYRPGADG